MIRSLRKQAKYFWKILFLLEVFPFLTLLYALWTDEAVLPFAALVGAQALLSAIFYVISLEEKEEYTFSKTLFFAAEMWLLLCFLWSIPFLVHGIDFFSSFFETTSGITTTGYSILDVSSLPRPLILWRSLMQWVGGAGVLAIFFLFSLLTKKPLHSFFHSETSSANRGIKLSWRRVNLVMWPLYVGLTAAEVLLLRLLGLDFFESLNISLTTVSTSGFTPFTGGMEVIKEHYSNWHAILITISVFSLIGGVNFVLIYFLLTTRKLKNLPTISKLEFSLYILFFLLGIYFIRASLVQSGLSSYDTFVISLFLAASFQSTTGFTFGDTQKLLIHPVSQLYYVFTSLFGGCSYSTSGAIKISRLIMLIKVGTHSIRKEQLPRNAVHPMKIGEIVVEDKNMVALGSLIVLWFTTIGFVTLITSVSYPQLNLLETSTLSLSITNSIGPTLAPAVEIPAWLKVFYSFAMIAGRLEILPIYLLLSMRLPLPWKKKDIINL